MHRGFRAEHGVVLHANVVALAVRQIGDVETHAEVGAVFGAKLRAASGEHGEVVLVRISEVGVEPGVKLDGDRVWYAAVPEAAAALAKALLAKILDDEGKSVAASSSARARVWSTHLHGPGSAWSSSRMMRKEKSVRKPPTTACLVPCHAEPTRFGTEGVSRSHD